MWVIQHSLPCYSAPRNTKYSSFAISRKLLRFEPWFISGIVSGARILYFGPEKWDSLYMAPKLSIFLIWRFLDICKKLKINNPKSKRYNTRNSRVIPGLRTNRARRRLACKFEMGLRASDCAMAVSDIQAIFSCYCFSTKPSHPVTYLPISSLVLSSSCSSYAIRSHFQFLPASK